MRDAYKLRFSLEHNNALKEVMKGYENKSPEEKKATLIQLATVVATEAYHCDRQHNSSRTASADVVAPKRYDVSIEEIGTLPAPSGGSRRGGNVHTV